MESINFVPQRIKDEQGIESEGECSKNISLISSIHNENFYTNIILRDECIITKVSKASESWCDLCELTVSNIEEHFNSIGHQFKEQEPKIERVFITPANKGYQMLARLGWRDDTCTGGLGLFGRGRRFPITTYLKRDKKGFGLEKLKPRITHFKPFSIDAIKFRSKATPIHKKILMNAILTERRKEIRIRRELTE